MSEPFSGLAWRKSTRCSTGACVEVARPEGIVLMRDSKSPEGPQLSFSPAAWADFMAGVKDDEFGGK